MIAVLASDRDAAARTLVDQWGADRAALLTCEDLSAPGWRHYLAATGDSVAVIGGQPVPLAEITGVVTCLPSVSELELLHIVPADRAYVAAEMTAFLLSWLSTLSCPVVNRPSPTCLCGPYWRPEQWAHAAAAAGLRVRPVHRRVALAVGDTPAVQAGVTVTVIGSRVLGEADVGVLSGIRRLAKAAGVELLAVRISDHGPDATFLEAELAPDLTSPQIAEAVLDYLTS